MTKIQKIRLAMTSINLLLFPISLYYLSPVISLQGSFYGIISGSIIIFLSLFISSLFLGRGFCGWMCPAGSLQDLVGKFRDKPIKPEKIRWIKYLIWVPWVSGILLFIRRTGGVRGVDFFYGTYHGFSVTSMEGLMAYISVVMIFYLLAVIIGKRAGCHVLCWIAPFMVPGRILAKILHLPALSIRETGTPCRNCERCTKACPMSIPVHTQLKSGYVSDTDCILCGTCTSVCPANAIKFHFGLPDNSRKHIPRQQPDSVETDTQKETRKLL